MKTKIKVCGVTRLDQALLMESMGVQFLGFNFVDSSPRYVKPQLASEIMQEMGTGFTSVGVFRNHGVKAIKRIVEEVGLDAVQFHGNEPVDLLAEFDIPRIKVFHVGDDFDPASTEVYKDVCEYFLFDTKKGSTSGGSGETFDWSLLMEYNFARPYFLAGGIGPLNAASAVAELAPFAVDLNSKIEIEPGVKDLELLEQCMKRIAKTEQIMAEDAEENP